jgi:FimV-like protein
MTKRIRHIALFATTLLVSVQLQAASYYGPTATSDRLYRIALSSKPSEQVSVGQTMVAIFQHNPEAFVNHNMNSLLAGSLLVIPTASEVAEIDARTASHIIADHNAHKNMPASTPVVAVVETSSSNVSQSDSIVAAMDAIPLPSPEVQSTVSMVTQENNSVQLSENDLYGFIVNKIDAAINERVRTIGEQHPQTVPGIVSQNTAEAEQSINPAEIHGSSVPAIGIDNNTVESANGVHLAQLRGHLNELQVQLTSIIHILEDNAEIFAVKDTLENKFADTGSYAVSHYLSKLYNLSPTDVKNPYVELGLALSIALLLLGLVIESRASYAACARVQEETLYDIEEDEYNYMGSEEGIPAKLNLARAYCDMGLPDKARKVLTEITARGDAQQREQAREMLMDMDK